MVPWWIVHEMTHHDLRVLLELSAFAGHEGAIGNEAVEGVAHEGELEEAVEILRPEVGSNLLQREMAVAYLGEIGERQLAVHEQPDLLQVLRAHMLAQRLPHGVRAGLRNRREDEAVLRRDDHRPVKFGCRFSRNAATPSR